MKHLRRCVTVLWVVLLAPAISSAQDQFFDSNGVTIHYIEQGRGEPIVLLHGVGGSLQNFVTRGVLPNLARDYRVIALDLRGHGQSGKPHDPKQYGREMSLDVVRLLDHLGIRRAHVVGYSLGAFLTAQLLTLHPDRFLTATLVAGPGLLRWTPELAREAEQEATEREKECASRTLMYLLAPPTGPTPTEEQINASAAACFADVNQDRFAIAALTRSRRDLVITPTAAAAVTVPTLAIVGSLDPNTPSMEQLKMLRPALKLVIVDGATHNGARGILAQPELLAALRQFLSTTHPPSP